MEAGLPVTEANTASGCQKSWPLDACCLSSFSFLASVTLLALGFGGAAAIRAFYRFSQLIRCHPVLK